MNIFAGAPRPVDPWVVLPKDPRRGPSTRLNGETFGTTGTIGRSTMMSGRNTAHMSQNVNAVIDSHDPHIQNDEDDALAPLLQRTLRRRGMSDSSIHSTFVTQSEEPMPLPGHEETSTADAWPTRAGVLRTFSRKVQHSFSFAAGSTTLGDTIEGSAPGVPAPVMKSSQPTSITEVPDESTNTGTSPHPPRTSSPISFMLPNMTSWTAAAVALEPGGSDRDSHFLVGSPRDEFMHRPWTRDIQGRDF